MATVSRSAGTRSGAICSIRRTPEGLATLSLITNGASAEPRIVASASTASKPHLRGELRRLGEYRLVIGVRRRHQDQVEIGVFVRGTGHHRAALLDV